MDLTYLLPMTPDSYRHPSARASGPRCVWGTREGIGTSVVPVPPKAETGVIGVPTRAWAANHVGMLHIFLLLANGLSVTPFSPLSLLSSNSSRNFRGDENFEQPYTLLCDRREGRISEDLSNQEYLEAFFAKIAIKNYYSSINISL